MSETEALLDLRRRMSLARLLLQLHAPASRERTEACAALTEVLPLLIADEPFEAATTFPAEE